MRVSTIYLANFLCIFSKFWRQLLVCPPMPDLHRSLRNLRNFCFYLVSPPPLTSVTQSFAKPAAVSPSFHHRPLPPSTKASPSPPPQSTLPTPNFPRYNFAFFTAPSATPPPPSRHRLRRAVVVPVPALLRHHPLNSSFFRKLVNIQNIPSIAPSLI